jgi:glycosyltransferase involved in cell wall biosynthesis
MKILILSDDFPPKSFGGAGIIASIQAQELQKRGHEVKIFTITDDEDKIDPRYRSYLSLYNIKTIKKIKKILKEFKPDIVHVHNIHEHISYASIYYAKKSGAKVFITLHDAMSVYYGKVPQNYINTDKPISLIYCFRTFGIRVNPFRNLIIRKLFNYADKIFVVAGWLLYKTNRKASLIFMTSPLIIIEGLINSHNDFIALALGIIGIYLLKNKRNVFALLIFITSGLIKFISLPIALLIVTDSAIKRVGKPSWNRFFLKNIQTWHIALAGILILLAYLISRQEIQPWYFLNLLIFLPFAPGLFEKFTIAFTGLLVSYYPYVLGGEWGQGGDVGVKRSIITYVFLFNVATLFMYSVYKKLKLSRA